jgi:NADPH:quinone reductase-like Zn-dependent oxidoreductase
LRTDIAGEVIEVGEGFTDITKGQRILAHAFRIRTGNLENYSFQKYTVVPACAASPIPDAVAYEAASVIPLAVSSAAAGLYAMDYLGLPFPCTNLGPTGKTILIWGGSSSVGSPAIQLAVASGLEIITTAYKKNFDHCKLGAKKVLDHSSTTIVAVWPRSLPTRVWLERMTVCVLSHNLNLPLTDIVSAIGKPGTTQSIIEVLATVGGGFVASTQAPPNTFHQR